MNRPNQFLLVAGALLMLATGAFAADPRAPQPSYCPVNHSYAVGGKTGVTIYSGTLIEQRRWTCTYSGAYVHRPVGGDATLPVKTTFTTARQ